MLRALFGVLVAHCCVACIGCGCSLAMCHDGGLINIRYPDELTPLQLELEIDGHRVTCSLPSQDDLDSAPCDDDRFNAWHRKLPSCTVTSQVSCDNDDKSEMYIHLSGTYARIDVFLKVNDVIVAQKDFCPHYDTVAPNGEWCGPVCEWWTETWELPS